ncbi:MAG: SDR family oxidoreductase [Pseudomonadota bacterium]
MSGDFDGKTVIVTGAGRGIGRSISARLIDRGARVMMADSDEDLLRQARDSFPDSTEHLARFTCNISQKFGVNNLLAATLDAFDRIDALITCPVDSERGDPLSLSADALDRVMASNLRSAFLVSKVIATRMIEQSKDAENGAPAGSIVHVSSLAGQIASPEITSFAISCAALDSLTRSLAVTLAPHRIRVNGVAPGGVMTNRLRDAIASHPELRPALINATPLGRIGDAEEAAKAALFLSSEQASFITGQIITVDGGRSALDPLTASEI